MINTATGMPTQTDSAPDVVYLRNTGFVLLAVTLMAGAISVVGALKTSKPLEMAQSAESALPADDLLLQQMEQSISEREMLQAHYVKTRSIWHDIQAHDFRHHTTSGMMAAMAAIEPAIFSPISKAQAATNVSVNIGIGTFYDRLAP